MNNRRIVKSMFFVVIGVLLGITVTVGYSYLSLEFFAELSWDDIPAETANTVLGVVLGFLSSTVLHIYINRRRQKQSATNLRKAFLSELESMNQFFKILNEGVNYDNAAAEEITGVVSTQVYDSNAQQIGNLKPLEVQNLATFYSSLDSIKTLINIAAKSDLEDIPDSMVPSRESQLHLNSMWLLTIREIRMNMPEDDRPPQPDLISIKEEWQEDINERLQNLLGDENVTAQEIIDDIDKDLTKST